MTRQAQVIKTGFCVAYDWRLLANSLPPVYQSSDVLCLALDKKRRSWSGNVFDFDEQEFRRLIASLDPDGKIIIYEDDFYRAGNSARENCNLHRTMLADRMGKGGWHVQIDSDEYFKDFDGFAQYLKKLNSCPTGNEKPFNVHVFLYDLVKKLEHGYLYVDPGNDRPFSAPFATTKPDYVRARHNGHFNKTSPFYVLHETWARGEDELRFKLSNWGHSSEEMKHKGVQESFIKLWRALDENNYQYVRNFHFAQPEGWPRLGYAQGSNIPELMKNFNPPFHISGLELALNNSRLVGKLRQLTGL